MLCIVDEARKNGETVHLGRIFEAVMKKVLNFPLTMLDESSKDVQFLSGKQRSRSGFRPCTVR
jgi:hypothetical protein